MKRTLDDFFVLGAPTAPMAPAVDAAHVLDAGATHVEVDVGDVRIVADKPVPKKARKNGGKSTGIYFTKEVAGRTAVPKLSHKREFGEFIDVGMEATGDAAFEYKRRRTQLAGKSEVVRGAVAEEVVKKQLTEMGSDVRAPEASNRVDGRARGKGKERYDLLVNDEKVEVKNARMTYTPSMQRWRLQFCNVKKSDHKRLILCFECFDGVRLYDWGDKGYGKNGQNEEACGGQVLVYASRSQPDALVAHDQLVAKMETKGNTLLKFVPYDDPDYADVWTMRTRTDEYYEGVPLATLSSTARGNALEAATRAFVARYLERTVADAPITQNVAGRSRGKNSTSCDLLVDGKRAEVKSCMMIWHKTKERFELVFTKVKPDAYDVLYLTWMTPRGVHIFEHKGDAGLSKAGRATDATGYKIKFTAPGGKTGLKVPADAERFLLKNLHWLKLPYLGFLEFNSGDAERVMERGAVLAKAGVDEDEE